MSNPWLTHLRAYYAKHKASGMSYSTAMKKAKATYKKKSGAASVDTKKKLP